MTNIERFRIVIESGRCPYVRKEMTRKGFRRICNLLEEYELQRVEVPIIDNIDFNRIECNMKNCPETVLKGE